MKEILLTKSQVAIIDDEQYERVSQFKWHVINPRGRRFYAVRSTHINGKKTMIYMARYILNASPKIYVDHINRNTLDNRVSNLRLCTNAQNMANVPKMRKPVSSKYKGVSWHRAGHKWQAHIHVNGQHMYLGLFTDEKTAARAYDDATRNLVGKFGICNFPL